MECLVHYILLRQVFIIFKNSLDKNHIKYFHVSGSSEERECGCSSLSIIGTRKQNADVIIRKKMIRIVAPLMMDKNLSVQSSAVGALRNISLADPEICEQMVIQDVMTPLCKRLLSYDHSDWKPVSKSKQFLKYCLETFCFQTFTFRSLLIVSTVKYLKFETVGKEI